jgi:magnesium chelatase subunit H
MDTHLASATARAQRQLARDLPGLSLDVHAASEWGNAPASLERCRADIARADIIIVTMMFLQDHIKAVLPALAERRDSCDALVACMSAPEVMRLTRVGRFSMSGEAKGPLALLKKLRGKRDGKAAGAGAQQMKMLRRIPQILRFVPGPAQDVRAYFLTLQYWLGGSEENVANMIRMLVDRFTDGPRRALRGTLKVQPPTEYPEIGLYHPRMKGRIGERADALPRPDAVHGTVGVLLLRSYPLAGNAAHYDGVIAELEARGLRVIPAFTSGLDSRPAVERFFLKDGKPVVDAVVSLTGFSLVGGPAYNDAHAAEEMLAQLDVPCVAAQPVEFQTLEQWHESDRGLMPVENTIMVAIPELDGTTAPMVFGGRSAQAPAAESRDMQSHPERAAALAARVAKLVALRRKARSERRVAIVLFNFPPNSGTTGTAAHLSVFASLHNTLLAMRAEGYTVEVPATVDALRERIIENGASASGAHAHVHARIPAADHVRREKHLAQIEAQWGAAPGRQQSDGSSIFVLGERFGNVLVGIQPAFGYEGDPMRLLFEKGFAPTHAFSAFYRYLREDFAADAVLHFGTHGALEFMPGKQSGLCGECWPERMIGDLPNFYLYAANNPSEGTIAKRRAAATLISYLTPPVTHAGLYRGLVDLKASIEQWRSLPPDADVERAQLAPVVQAQAAAVELAAAEPAWDSAGAEQRVLALHDRVRELEDTLIPHGLHVVGAAMDSTERRDVLAAMAENAPAGMSAGADLGAIVDAIVSGPFPSANAPAFVAKLPAEVREPALSFVAQLERTDRELRRDAELPALMRALDGRFIRPSPGGDMLRTPEVLPSGRNVHGFDPFRIPSTYALADGARQADRLIAKHIADGNSFPHTIALVLWGTDNLKTEGGPIAQALALLGAQPVFDGYGRLSGASLVPLEKLGRPRIDVVVTLSGIFRDLLPLQIKLLAEASFLAASADEPLEQNFVRRHALEYQAAHGCDLETAALRVFGNAEGAYGSNVNHLVENGRWDEGDELAETFTRRKSFAYGRGGGPVQQTALLNSMLADVQLAYQNLDSVDLGVTDVDTYFDTLGGIGQAVRRSKGGYVPIYIGDQTRGAGTVRTLGEQVALETRTRTLNPKWYEGMLKHGYEGVRQIELHVTNTMGWSATTGQVEPWVYQELTNTFVLDPEMRKRLAELNPTASAKVANRLIEAHERKYWSPDAATLDALQRAGDELEDRLEGVYEGVAA